MMDKQQVKSQLEAAIESLARIEHERWAHWQRYMHSKSAMQPDGSMVVPADLVAQWSRQIETSYDDLTPAEQESDREQVRRYLPTVLEALAGE